MNFEIKEIDKDILLLATYLQDVDLNLLYIDKRIPILLDTSYTSEIEELVQGIRLPKIALVSHSHYDHAGGSGKLANLGVEIRSHPITKSLLSSTYTSIYSFFPHKYAKFLSTKYTKEYYRYIRTELGYPKIHSTNFDDIHDIVEVVEGEGHVAGTLLFRIRNILFTSDGIQGEGIMGSSKTNAIPQISDIKKYLVTLQKVIKMNPEIIILGHNYLHLIKE